MIFVDSNIWCYYFDQRLPEYKYVREPMRKILKNEEIVCNTIIIMEVAHYLVRHLPAEDSRRKIEYLVNLENMKIVDFDRQTMIEALENLTEYAYTHGLGGRDSTVIATLKTLGINKILTHDEVFKRLASKLATEILDPIPANQK
ncbi:MAG: type II toxin-antitoxin system VapC family toxin [Candidatus Bathyarchaeia archaeon]